MPEETDGAGKVGSVTTYGQLEDQEEKDRKRCSTGDAVAGGAVGIGLSAAGVGAYAWAENTLLPPLAAQAATVIGAVAFVGGAGHFAYSWLTNNSSAEVQVPAVDHATGAGAYAPPTGGDTSRRGGLGSTMMGSGGAGDGFGSVAPEGPGAGADAGERYSTLDAGRQLTVPGRGHG